MVLNALLLFSKSRVVKIVSDRIFHKLLSLKGGGGGGGGGGSALIFVRTQF